MNFVILILIAVNISSTNPRMSTQLLEKRYTTPKDCQVAGEALIQSMKEQMNSKDAVIIAKCLQTDDVEV